ncbi:hypothetical protein GCM10010121_093890 [Streptomyces brasiliensis]|uniref:Transposase n=1 Tax=Streptomyces brasiliensis TaxID=1954 RepID=A0A917PA53_9ACTN|nr:hypothetical protein GCM10010121_093890 [Streptomyces brasiliensis]
MTAPQQETLPQTKTSVLGRRTDIEMPSGNTSSLKHSSAWPVGTAKCWGPGILSYTAASPLGVPCGDLPWPAVPPAVVEKLAGRCLRPVDRGTDTITQLIPLLDAIPRIRGPCGRPRHRPMSLFAHLGYDHRVGGCARSP